MAEPEQIRRPTSRTRRAALAVAICSMLVAGIGIGLAMVMGVPEVGFVAVCGAVLGAVVGNLIAVVRTTGWLMLAGAVIGGVAAILLTGIGKAAIYGVPIGTIMGLAVGLAIEQNNARRPKG